MTTKERNLAYVLGGVLGVLLVGVAAYLFVLSPYLDAAEQVRGRQKDVDDLSEKALKIQLDKVLFQYARQQSLPLDAKLSRGQYATFLETLARKADIAPAAMKVASSDPDDKSGLIPGTKKSAYKKLAYTVTLRADLYRVTDLLRRFYQQPLLHAIKSINLQKPSDAKAQGSKELDVTLAIEALVLDGAPDRPTLLPVAPAVGLVSGAALQTLYNSAAVNSGAGTPVPVDGVLAEPKREYLAIAGKNPFYGPPPKISTPEEQPAPREMDSSPYITLTSIIGDPEKGTLVAVFWDKLTNNNHTITQSATGAIAVVGEFELLGKKKTAPGYDRSAPAPDILYGTKTGQNQRAWRVRRVTETEVIVEKLELKEALEKPKPPMAVLFGGGAAAFVAVPEGKVSRIAPGQSLESPPPYLLTREAWKAIYVRAKPALPAPREVQPVSTDRGR